MVQLQILKAMFIKQYKLATTPGWQKKSKTTKFNDNKAIPLVMASNPRANLELLLTAGGKMMKITNFYMVHTITGTQHKQGNYALRIGMYQLMKIGYILE